MLDLSRLSSLGEALSDATITYKSFTALIEADRERESGRWTYRQLRDEARRFGALLQERGFGPDDRCAILMSNQARWLLSATGALWAGATLVPLDYKLTPPEQLALLAHCRPRVLVTELGAWRKLRREDRASVLDGILALVPEAPPDAALDGAERWETRAAGELCPVPRSRDDVACIVYSSGTGGTPKGCMLTHHNYLSQAEVLGCLYPLEPSDRYFSILPTNHAIDFMCGFVIPLLFGAAVVHQRTLRPKYLGPTMKRYGVTHMALVPAILDALEKRVQERLDERPEWQRWLVSGLAAVNEQATRERPNHRLSSLLLRPIHEQLGGKLRLMFCGGAFTSRTTAEHFYRLGLPVVIGYGLTEAGTVLTVNDLRPFRGDTVGKPVPGTEIEVRGEDENGVGEVWARGPTVMKGYLGEPELTAQSIVDGWLRTGDLGRLDAAGHLVLVGRAKNMIVTAGGKNIYPEDIEAAFDDLPGCEEMCVFAANYVWPEGASLTGEQLMIVVRPQKDEGPDGGGALLAELVRELGERNRRLVDYKRLSGYVVWPDELPRTASMKVKRGVLASLLSEKLDRSALRELWTT